jgi:hypothetical protein
VSNSYGFLIYWLGLCVTAFGWQLSKMVEFATKADVLVTALVLAFSSIMLSIAARWAFRRGTGWTLCFLACFPALWFVAAGIGLKAVVLAYLAAKPDFSIDVSCAFLASSYYGTGVAWIASVGIVAIHWVSNKRTVKRTVESQPV